MAFDSVENDLKALVCMARLAFPFVHTRCKLSAVIILVTVCTEMKPRNVKTPLAAGVDRAGSKGVTSHAFDLRVLSVEWEFRPLVIERPLLHRFPVCRGMALVATTNELLHVRVAVARFTGSKFHSSIENGFRMLHSAIVTLLALDLLVLPGQWVAGTIMQKARRGLPSFRVVA
jgi:hypothetical protein